MGKQKIKKKNGTIWLTNQLGKFERFSSEEWKIQDNHEISGLLPIMMEQNRRKCTLMVSLTGMVSLKTYTQEEMNMQAILAFLWSTVRIARKCERHGLRVESLCWDSEYVFVDQSRGRIQMVYWPVISLAEKSSGPLEFYSGFLQLMQDNGMLPEIYSTYRAYFYQRTIFDLNLFYQTMSEIMEYWRDYQINHQSSPERKLDSDGGHRMPIANKENLMGWLERGNPSEKIQISGGRLYFGRDSTLCDIEISDDLAVSRQHGVIFLKENRYFLMDLNSKNGTYLNDERLVGGQQRSLDDGDIVRFADTAYTFHVQQPSYTVDIHHMHRGTQ